MLVEEVTDSQDPRLRDYVALTDVKLRRRTEPAAGLFIAEGEKVIRRALAAGHRPRSVLLAERWLTPLRDALTGWDVPVYVAPAAVLEQVTGYRVHRGALASMHRPAPTALDRVIGGAQRLAVLEDVNDHENVGAIFRAAAALGMDAVLLSPRCADPLYRRSIKVSMGAVFAIPWARCSRWPEDLEAVRQAGLRLVALTPAHSAVSLREVPPGEWTRCAVLLGTEGRGLSERALAAADLPVRIPMARGVDSLNVAAAAAVAFYAAGVHR